MKNIRGVCNKCGSKAHIEDIECKDTIVGNTIKIIVKWNFHCDECDTRFEEKME